MRYKRLQQTAFNILFIFISFVFCNSPVVSAGQGSKFIYTQLVFDGNWDPHPGAYEQIYTYLLNTTSLRIEPQRRKIRLSDPLLFSSPFLVFTGHGPFPKFTDIEIENLKRYLEGGGLLFIDTGKDIDFSFCADRMMKRVFPARSYKKISSDDAIFKAYYLVDYVAGMTIRYPYMESINLAGKIAVIKSHNELLGVWSRDRTGNWVNPLQPDKYQQRKESLKLTLNIILYSVCGSYKSDPVHQGSIKMKLGR